MEANQLDSNVLLPPRKRLLACMKYQNRNGNGDSDSNPNPPSTSSSMNNFSPHLNNLLSVHLSDNNLSQLKIVEASRSAAEAAAKIAIAARAVAEKKAVMAAVAMTAAKKALELVATINEQEASSSTSNKNKRKKHVEVQMLYERENLEENSPSGNSKSKLISDEVACDVNVDVNVIKGKKLEEDKGYIGRKRGRMKQKKLPLSICHDRGQLNPNEEHINQNSLWKCQAFKAGARLKENKSMQS